MTTEELLKHHGIKGMKWGVRRDKKRAAINTYKKTKSEIKADYKSGKIKKSVYKERIREAQHKRNMVTSFVYKNSYAISKSKGLNHVTARSHARTDLAIVNGLKAGVTAYAITSIAAPAVGAGARLAANPATIRAGKNIIQAMKGSPIRYVDGRTMQNVINLAGTAIGR